MRNILSDSSKFTQFSLVEDKQLNFIVSDEKHIADLLKDIKSKIISETVYKVWNKEGLDLEFFMVFVKFTVGW